MDFNDLLIHFIDIKLYFEYLCVESILYVYLLILSKRFKLQLQISQRVGIGRGGFHVCSSMRFPMIFIIVKKRVKINKLIIITHFSICEFKA